MSGKRRCVNCHEENPVAGCLCRWCLRAALVPLVFSAAAQLLLAWILGR